MTGDPELLPKVSRLRQKGSLALLLMTEASDAIFIGRPDGYPKKQHDLEPRDDRPLHNQGLPTSRTIQLMIA